MFASDLWALALFRLANGAVVAEDASGVIRGLNAVTVLPREGDLDRDPFGNLETLICEVVQRIGIGQLRDEVRLLGGGSVLNGRLKGFEALIDLFARSFLDGGLLTGGYVTGRIG